MEVLQVPFPPAIALIPRDSDMSIFLSFSRY